MRMIDRVLCLIPAFAIISFSVLGAAPQEGPAYYSDVHGAGALIRSMHAMGKIDPKYYEIRDQTINWSLKQRRDFPTGGRTWLQNPSAPKGHPSYRRAITTIPKPTR